MDENNDGCDSSGYGYTAAGEWVSSREPGFDNDNGVGPSWLKRCFYLAYLGGANLMELEHWYLKILAPEGKDFRLSRIGRHFTDFCSYAESNPDRGIPYTPVALLTPFLQAYPQWGGNTVGDYTPGTFSLDAFWATIVPSYDRSPALKRGEQGALFNSQYGDIYDVICPDAPEQRNLTDVLKAYKVAILLGDIKPGKELTAALENYVEQGGTLVLSTCQLERYFPEKKAGLKRLNKKAMLKENISYLVEKVELKGARVLTSSRKGRPLLTACECGKGRVIVSTIDNWVPALCPEYASQTRRGILTFPYVQALLKQIVAEVLPVSVKGDVQYGINRTSDGYLVYLINNRGITKMADTAEVVDETAVSTVQISWQGDDFSRAVELRRRQGLDLADRSIGLSVGPGEVSVVRLYEK